MNKVTDFCETRYLYHATGNVFIFCSL